MGSPKAPGGAGKVVGWSARSGGGFEGDAVAESFELADMGAFLGGGADVVVVVVRAEVLEPGLGVG